MEDTERLRQEYQIAILQDKNHVVETALYLANMIRRRRGQRRRGRGSG